MEVSIGNDKVEICSYLTNVFTKLYSYQFLRTKE